MARWVEAEAAGLRRAVELIVDEGLASLGEVSERLHAEGHRTKTGGRWVRQTLRTALLNPHVAGLGSFKGELLGPRFEPIVPVERWEAARSALTVRPGQKAKGRPSVGRHLLAGGFAVCASCGDPMLSRTRRGRRLYVCRSHERRSTSCPQGWLDGDAIDAALSDYLLDAAVDAEATVAQLTVLAERQLADAAALAAEAERDAMRAEDYGRRALREWEAGGDNGPSLAFVEATVEKYQAEAAAAQARADAQRSREARLARSTLVEEAAARAREALDAIRASGGSDALRALLPRLFRRVVVATVGAVIHPDVLPSGMVAAVSVDTRVGEVLLMPEPLPEAVVQQRGFLLASGAELELDGLERLPLYGDSEVITNQLRPKASTPSSRRTNRTAPVGPPASRSRILTTL